MTLSTSTLRPGLLVSLKSEVHGNVAYRKQELEAEHATADGALKARWETERTINDPVEFEAACKVRAKARAMVASVCAASAFGLLCPESKSDQLAAAVAEARKVAEAFNLTATLTRVHVNVIAGRIAADDVDAVRAINSELRELLERMETGVRNLDVAAVRDAAKRARGLGQMLSPEAAAKVRIAVDAARATATKINAAGEQAAQEIDKQTLQTLAETRTAFLDLDPVREVAAPTVQGRALDLEPERPLTGAEKAWRTRRAESAKLEV